MRRLIIPAIFALCATVCQPVARGQAKADLPTADTVINQYIEATGGKAAYEKAQDPRLDGHHRGPGRQYQGYPQADAGRAQQIGLGYRARSRWRE